MAPSNAAPPQQNKIDPTMKRQYFDKWTRFRTKMNKGLIEMISNPRLKRRIDKGAVPFFRADKNMCHFALDQATEEYLEGRKLKPSLQAETFVEFGIPRAQLDSNIGGLQVKSDMNNNSDIGMPRQRRKRLERKDWNDISAPVPKPRKKKKHRDYVDGRKVDRVRNNKMLSPMTATGIPKNAPLYVNTSSIVPPTTGEKYLQDITPRVTSPTRVQQPMYIQPVASPKNNKQILVNIPKATSPLNNQHIYVNTPPVVPPSKPPRQNSPSQPGPSNAVPHLGKSQNLPHRFIPNYTPDPEHDDDDGASASSTEPDFDELSRYRAHGHNKRASLPPPPVPPHRTPFTTAVNEMDISSELSSTSRPRSRYTGESFGSIFRRHDSTLTGKSNSIKWSAYPNGGPLPQRKISAKSYTTHATWKTTGTLGLIAKRHPEDAGVDELTFGISEYVIDNGNKGPGSVLVTGGVPDGNKSTFESEVLY